jgi:hypothetical protein
VKVKSLLFPVVVPNVLFQELDEVISLFKSGERSSLPNTAGSSANRQTVYIFHAAKITVNATHNVLRLNRSFNSAQTLLGSPQPQMQGTMNQQQQVNINPEYSESEYEDDEQQGTTKTSATASSPRLQRLPDVNHSPVQDEVRNGQQLIRSSSNSTGETEEYLRRNGFDLHHGLGTSTDSYALATDTPPSSVASDTDRPLPQAVDVFGRRMSLREQRQMRLGTHPAYRTRESPLQFDSASLHNPKHSTTSVHSDSPEQPAKEVFRVGRQNPLWDPLTPQPLDIESIAARRSASTRGRGGSSNAASPTVQILGRRSSQSVLPESFVQRMKAPDLDTVPSDSDSDEDELVARAYQKRDRVPPQGILNVTDLRPAQASGNPSHILRFQVIPSQPSPVDHIQSTHDLVAGYSIGRYVTDTKAPLSTASLPFHQLGTKKVPKWGVRGFIERCKGKITKKHK